MCSTQLKGYESDHRVLSANTTSIFIKRLEVTRGQTVFSNKSGLERSRSIHPSIVYTARLLLVLFARWRPLWTGHNRTDQESFTPTIKPTAVSRCLDWRRESDLMEKTHADTERTWKDPNLTGIQTGNRSLLIADCSIKAEIYCFLLMSASATSHVA